MKNMQTMLVYEYDPIKFEILLVEAIRGLDVIDIKFSVASAPLDPENNRESSRETYSAIILYK